MSLRGDSGQSDGGEVTYCPEKPSTAPCLYAGDTLLSAAKPILGRNHWTRAHVPPSHRGPAGRGNRSRYGAPPTVRLGRAGAPPRTECSPPPSRDPRRRFPDRECRGAVCSTELTALETPHRDLLQGRLVLPFHVLRARADHCAHCSGIQYDTISAFHAARSLQVFLAR
jgi:hypothetical protein